MATQLLHFPQIYNCIYIFPFLILTLNLFLQNEIIIPDYRYFGCVNEKIISLQKNFDSSLSIIECVTSAQDVLATKKSLSKTFSKWSEPEAWSVWSELRAQIS